MEPMDIGGQMDEHAAVLKSTKTLAKDIVSSSERIYKALEKGNTLLICGNGGSAADAQHFAAELTGRYKKERKGLSAVALTTDTSALTAIGNDYGFDYVFSRQVEALGKKGDVLFLISTSGNSANLIEAAKKAREIGMSTIALLGKEGGRLKGICDHSLVIPSDNTPRIQEMHVMIVHMICEQIENKLG